MGVHRHLCRRRTGARAEMNQLANGLRPSGNALLLFAPPVNRRHILLSKDQHEPCRISEDRPHTKFLLKKGRLHHKDVTHRKHHVYCIRCIRCIIGVAEGWLEPSPGIAIHQKGTTVPDERLADITYTECAEAHASANALLDAADPITPDTVALDQTLVNAALAIRAKDANDMLGRLSVLEATLQHEEASDYALALVEALRADITTLNGAMCATAA